MGETMCKRHQKKNNATSVYRGDHTIKFLVGSLKAAHLDDSMQPISTRQTITENGQPAHALKALLTAHTVQIMRPYIHMSERHRSGRNIKIPGFACTKRDSTGCWNSRALEAWNKQSASSILACQSIIYFTATRHCNECRKLHQLHHSAGMFVLAYAASLSPSVGNIPCFLDFPGNTLAPSDPFLSAS